jgi:DNA-binding NtrC family response regulator
MSKDDRRENLATVALPRVQKAASTAEAFVLEVTEGPDKGLRFVVDAGRPPRLLVGGSPACDLKLADPQVSRRHAALELRDGALLLGDLGSTNGTSVNGVAIGEAFLRGGEVVRLGATAIRVSPSAQAAAAAPSTASSFGRMLGGSAEMRRLYPLCERLAASDVPVLIEGETGTGKELLAEALHEASPRAGGPFVVFDCTAVPPSLVEAARFGHERGSFTGATEMRRGVFEQADGGTLLIDEIGDLEQALQPKLLRAIERAEIRRVGGDRPIKVDVRVISATRRDLDKEIQEGRFRDDLFFRLAVARVELPPLRRRLSDVALLAERFWRELGGVGPLPPEWLAASQSYGWPGNVRELRNAIARRIALGDLGEDLPAAAEAVPPEGAHWADEILALDLPWPRARERVLDELQRRYVARVLEQHGGNVSRAAAASGIARRYFQILRARQGSR